MICVFLMYVWHFSDVSPEDFLSQTKTQWTRVSAGCRMYHNINKSWVGQM